VSEVWDRLRYPVGHAFNLHENVVKASKFFEVRSFVDVMIAKQFEGLAFESRPVVKDLLEYSMYMLTKPVNYEPQVQKLSMSKLLQSPINLMESIVKSEKNGKEIKYKKYEMTSAHDEQISNLWEFLEPHDFV
jgi:hypothetical protein